jgi:hypothetical protein
MNKWKVRAYSVTNTKYREWVLPIAISANNKQYLQEPNSVDSSWIEYFSSINNSLIRNDGIKTENQTKQGNSFGYDLLRYYRQYGHQGANLDPLGRQNIVTNHQVKITDKNDSVDLSDSSIFNNISLGELESVLKQTYSGSIGFEFEHIDNLDEKDWLYNKVESEAWKIESFFSNQLAELKAHYEQKRGGRVYTEPTKEKALNRCLELADFPVTLEDIQEDIIRCKCDKEVFGYVCVNPESKFFFVVARCQCEQKGGEKWEL